MGLDLLKAATETRAPFSAGVGKVATLALENKDEEAARTLLGEVRSAQQAYLKAIDEVVAHQKMLMEASAKEIADRSAGACIAWTTARSITQPLAEAIVVRRQDGTGRLLSAMREMQASLVEESAAAAKSLKEQAKGMVDTVAVFKLSGASMARPAPSPRAVKSAAPKPMAKKPMAATPAVKPMAPKPTPAPAVEDGEWASF